jgi:hypothetical protein
MSLSDEGDALFHSLQAFDVVRGSRSRRGRSSWGRSKCRRCGRRRHREEQKRFRRPSRERSREVLRAALAIVSPPGAGQVIRGSIATPVFEGHGATVPGSLTIPPGTYLQIPTSEFVAMANKTAGVWEQVAARGTLGSGGVIIPPGGTAPNLVRYPPTPGMGFCVWGACR